MRGENLLNKASSKDDDKEVKLVFADDSERRKPRRSGMDHLVAFGGFLLDADRAGDVERVVEGLTKSVGFPDGSEFKWSPGKDLWMRENLVEEERADFFRKVLGVLD